MKKISSLILLLTGFGMSFAQTDNWCGTDANNASIFEANPGLEMQMHEHLMRVTSGMYSSDDRDEECIVPVVVHILHNDGAGNISNEQVLSGIDMLNDDFNRENADAVDTRDTDEAPFTPVASDMGIRFELAKIDPDGNCTNGIQRRFVGSLSYNADNSAKHYSSGGLDAWDRNYYFNIWIVNSIDSDGGTILGYAEFPYGGGSSNYGVIIRNDSYGYVGTASGDRTLTHEVGHCFGLFHTFQSGCHTSNCNSNGDYCCDTPPVSEAQWSCVVTQNTCDEIPSGDPYEFDANDQFENYMSYSPCQNMYSEDQKNLVLGNLESIAFLSNLVDPDHHDETGVGLPAVLCKAQFSTNVRTICAGNSLQYFDDSYANVTGWNWTFDGGTPETSTEENPIVTYDTPGFYTVNLEVTDGISTVSTALENYLNVLSNPGTSLPYSEDFESIAAIPDFDRFMILDEDEEDEWELTDAASFSGSHSVYINNRGNNNRTKDQLISGTIDLSGVDEEDDIIFTFKYAYKKRREDDDEWLRFYISKDCGLTWALRKNIHGDGLSEEVQSSSYTPETPEEWTEVTIYNILPDYYTADFRYRFEFENDDGNNIYIDDINLFPESMLGLLKNQPMIEMGIELHPNPAQDNMTVTLMAANDTDVTLTLHDALGQEIETVFQGSIVTGKNQINYDVNHLPAGIYFIRTINAEGLNEVARFVKK